MSGNDKLNKLNTLINLKKKERLNEASRESILKNIDNKSFVNYMLNDIKEIKNVMKQSSKINSNKSKKKLNDSNLYLESTESVINFMANKKENA
jgi:hypothetical protein